MGHKNGLQKDSEKISALVDAAHAEDVTTLKGFFRLANYNAKFIPNISTMLKPLYNLLKKNVELSSIGLLNVRIHFSISKIL